MWYQTIIISLTVEANHHRGVGLKITTTLTRTIGILTWFLVC